MKKLLLASLLLAIGVSAHATPILSGRVCTGTAGSVTCTDVVTCTGSCQVKLNTETNATCTPSGTTVDNLPMDLEGIQLGPAPICTWNVRDLGDRTELVVTMSAEDGGLPVELQSVTVE